MVSVLDMLQKIRQQINTKCCKFQLMFSVQYGNIGDKWGAKIVIIFCSIPMNKMLLLEMN